MSKGTHTLTSRNSAAALAALLATAAVALGSRPVRAGSANWSWINSPGVDSLGVGSPELMVRRLARKLRDHPNDLAGWLLLGRSDIVLHRYPLAERAYRRASHIAHGRSAAALLGEAQALTLIDGKQLTGRAGELIERALAIAPRDPEALFYGALVAYHRGRLTLARTRYARLLALNPSPQTKALVQTQIAAINRKLAGGKRARAASSAVTAAPRIRVRVALAPRLAGKAPRSAALYVFVRDAAQPGPPLAVLRLQNRFPQTVQLTPADAMIAGHSFKSGERVDVVARIAPSGNPLEASGDLSGDTPYRVGRDGLVPLLIDRVTP